MKNIILDLYRIINKKFLFTIICFVIILSYNYYMFIQLNNTYFIEYIYSLEIKNFIELLSILLYYISILIPIFAYMKIELSSYSYSIATRVSKNKYLLRKIALIILYSLIVFTVSFIIIVSCIAIVNIKTNVNLIELSLRMVKTIFLIIFTTFTVCACIRDIPKSELFNILLIIIIMFLNRHYKILTIINNIYFLLTFIEIILLNSSIKRDKIGLKRGDN